MTMTKVVRKFLSKRLQDLIVSFYPPLITSRRAQKPRPELIIMGMVDSFL